MIESVLLALACVHLGILFMVAGLGKALTPGSLRADLRNDELLPASLGGVVAMCLPMLEVGVALALVGGFEPRYSASVAAILLLTFGAYRAALFVRGAERSDAPCGCFGAISRSPSTGSPSSDLTATGLNSVIAAVVAFFGSRDYASSAAVSWSLLFFAITATAVIVTIHSLHHLHSRSREKRI